MGLPRRAYGVYFAMVFAASTVLWVGARIAPTLVFLVACLPVYLTYGLLGEHSGSLILSPVAFLLFSLFLLLLTLPTLGAMLSRGAKIHAWLLIQFVVLVVYFFLNALLVFRPH